MMNLPRKPSASTSFLPSPKKSRRRKHPTPPKTRLPLFEGQRCRELLDQQLGVRGIFFAHWESVMSLLLWEQEVYGLTGRYQFSGANPRAVFFWQMFIIDHGNPRGPPTANAT